MRTQVLPAPLAVPRQHAGRGLWQRTPFAAMADSRYQRYSLAALLGFTALAVQTMTRAWMLQDMTRSPLLVSLSAALLMFPMLFLSMLGGELADRFSRKLITFLYEATSVATYVVLTVLAMTGAVQPWHVLALTAIQGVAGALASPARQTLITDLVPARDSRGAIGLSMLFANLAAIIGPGVAGWAIAEFGTTHALAAGVVIGALGLPLYLSLKANPPALSARHGGGMVQNLKEGLVYIRGDASLRWLLLACVVMILTVNSWGALFPTFAEDVLKIGPRGLGVLAMAVGIGALAATVLVVFMSGRIPDKAVEIASGFLFAAFAFGMAMSTSYLFTVAAAMLAAFAATCFFQTNLTAVQLHAPEEFRGRVISVRFVAWGLQPVGLLAIGGLAEAAGGPAALAAFSIAGALTFAVLIAVLRPHKAHREVRHRRKSLHVPGHVSILSRKRPENGSARHAAPRAA
ncbi:MAG: MFS transporter [Chloroflexi bacterium]|nr:MFS transporter [Chloroflexota bacterium]